jgi:hypothetical protein
MVTRRNFTSSGRPPRHGGAGYCRGASRGVGAAFGQMHDVSPRTGPDLLPIIEAPGPIDAGWLAAHRCRGRLWVVGAGLGRRRRGECPHLLTTPGTPQDLMLEIAKECPDTFDGPVADAHRVLLDGRDAAPCLVGIVVEPRGVRPNLRVERYELVHERI